MIVGFIPNTMKVKCVYEFDGDLFAKCSDRHSFVAMWCRFGGRW